MKSTFRQFVMTLAVLASFILGTGAWACSPRTIEKAESSSKKLATYANAGVNITRDLYHEKIISLAVKDKIADAFIVLSDGGIAFDKAVANAKAAYGANPPKSAIDALFATFNSEVVMKFLDVLTKLKLVTDSSAYLAIIEAVKAAVLIIAGAFGKRAVVEAQL